MALLWHFDILGCTILYNGQYDKYNKRINDLFINDKCVKGVPVKDTCTSWFDNYPPLLEGEIVPYLIYVYIPLNQFIFKALVLLVGPLYTDLSFKRCMYFYAYLHYSTFYILILDNTIHFIQMNN